MHTAVCKDSAKQGMPSSAVGCRATSESLRGFLLVESLPTTQLSNDHTAQQGDSYTQHFERLHRLTHAYTTQRDTQQATQH